MTTSLKNKESGQDVIEELIGERIFSLSKIGGGLNSQVYQVKRQSGEDRVAKLYFRHKSDKRDRLGMEFLSFKFLWNNQIQTVPEPITMGEQEGCAIYSFIEGEKVSPKDITKDDVAAAVEFIERLNSIKNEQGSDAFPPASEAFFSIGGILKNMEERIQRLLVIDDLARDLEGFLANDYIPFYQELVTAKKKQAQEWSISFAEEIPLEQRILSPSDFGFHNALKNSDGKITFLDFEYFGWDDPAKLISDFLLHPAMNLSEELQGIFLENVLKVFKDNTDLRNRVNIVRPFFWVEMVSDLLK